MHNFVQGPYNPLVDDLSGLPETAILEKMQNLQKHINGAYNMGKWDMLQQLNTVMEMCRSELLNRQIAKAQQSQKDGPDPFKSIDIG